jgi:hypothetical protein
MPSVIPLTGIRLQPDLKLRAVALAARRGISLSGFIGFVLGEYVDEHLPLAERVSTTFGANPLTVPAKPIRAGSAQSSGPSRQQRRAAERADRKEQR